MKKNENSEITVQSCPSSIPAAGLLTPTTSATCLCSSGHLPPSHSSSSSALQRAPTTERSSVSISVGATERWARLEESANDVLNRIIRLMQYFGWTEIRHVTIATAAVTTRRNIPPSPHPRTCQSPWKNYCHAEYRPTYDRRGVKVAPFCSPRRALWRCPCHLL